MRSITLTVKEGDVSVTQQFTDNEYKQITEQLKADQRPTLLELALERLMDELNYRKNPSLYFTREKKEKQLLKG